MNGQIGWRYPPTNGGRVDGFNDPGIAHFNGTPVASLARETIQNSLDAGSSDSPVQVTFELVLLDPEHLGKDELANAIEACKPEAKNDKAAREFLREATQVLKQKKVTCLRVSDRNTSGLLPDQWHALVKMQGVSLKPGLEGAGGSHGIGKYAPFAVSTLRTVFYWTCYREEGNRIETFQGKSVLMSHEGDEGETQGTGFYGTRNGCRELTDTEVPQPFRMLEKDTTAPIQGTSLTIAGFREPKNWRWRIAASVIESFFYAVDRGKLTVIVEPDLAFDALDLFEIDKSSLGDWFDFLEKSIESEDYGGVDIDRSLRQARAFWDISKGEPQAEKQDQDLGHCRLWIRVEDGLPSKVGFVRQTGMLVTTQQPRLIRFPGYQDFAALCVFDDPKGNELLRRMENPQHDKFEPDRLTGDEQKKGRRALARVVNWIREEIRKYAAPPAVEGSIDLSELAAYLPNFHPNESIEDTAHGDGSKREQGFGDRVQVTLKPIRRPMPSLSLEEESDEDGDSDGDNLGLGGGAGTGSNGGGNGNGGHGEGDGSGGTGVKGGGHRNAKRLPVSNIRLLPIPGHENRYQLRFRAGESGVAKLKLEEAGDSSLIPREDIRTVNDDESLEEVKLVEGQYCDIDITADMPMNGRAWHLSATELDKDSQ